jgi:hypothetical protein
VFKDIAVVVAQRFGFAWCKGLGGRVSGLGIRV